MNTSNISWGIKMAGANGGQPYHLHVATVMKSGSLDLLEPSRHVQACTEIALTFYDMFGGLLAALRQVSTYMLLQTDNTTLYWNNID
jgi:hypothetical protein